MGQSFHGLGMHLGNLSRLSQARTRSISAENPTGERGQGGWATTGTGANASRDLGVGWKVSRQDVCHGSGWLSVRMGMEFVPEFLAVVVGARHIGPHPCFLLIEQSRARL